MSLLLFACTQTVSTSPTPSQAAVPGATATTAPSPVAPATVTPSTATETSPAPSPTSAQATSPATQVPQQLVIEPQNAADLQQVDQIGLPGVVNFAWLPDGSSLALATETEIDLYRTNPVEEFGKINAPATTVLTPSPDGEQLATAGTDNHDVHLWTLPDGTELHTLTGHTAAVTGLSFSPDGKTLASSSEDSSIKLWDTTSGEMLRDWKVSYLPSGVAFSPDGELVAGFDNQDFAVHLLKASDGQEQRTLTWTEHASPVLYSASFSSDWHNLAWVARGTVQLMDVESGDLGQVLSHEDFVSAISWSPDERLLASAAAATVDGDFQPAILVWDTAAGQTTNTIPQPEPIVNLAFSPDGSLLAALNGSGTINLLAIPK